MQFISVVICNFIKPLFLQELIFVYQRTISTRWQCSVKQKPVYNVFAQIETINGEEDTINWNDMVWVSAMLKPLAEFYD